MKLSESHHLQLCYELLSSLPTDVSDVKTFKVKWSLINSKLQQLPTHLKDMADCPTFSTNKLSQDLVKSLSQTLTDCGAVLRRCRGDPTLSSGKLQTQSDLDSVNIRLDHHLRDADLLVRSGVLHDSTHLAPGPRREAVRAEARSLITKLQIGNFDSKSLAMDTLLNLLCEDDKNVLIAVAQGVVPLVVKLLDSTSVDIKEKAVAAIARISTVDSSKHLLVAEGILLLNHLLRILESGTGTAKDRACVALQALSSTKENARTIGSSGGISSLLEMCHAGTPSTRAVAAGVLRNIAAVQETRLNFVEENAVPVLITLATSGTRSAQENAVGCLCNLTSEEDESWKFLVVREGAVHCLKIFWDEASWTRGDEAAVNLLRNLASCRSIADLLLSSGFVPRLVLVLNSGVSAIRIAAAKAIDEMGYSTKAKKEMGEAGCVPPLLRMFDGKAVGEKEAAAKAVSHLLLYVGNRRLLRREQNGVENLVCLLDPSLQNVDMQKHAISMLASLSDRTKCRKRMVASGACGYLEKLVEMDVEGAKKLLEALGRGRLWEVFSKT